MLADRRKEHVPILQISQPEEIGGLDQRQEVVGAHLKIAGQLMHVAASTDSSQVLHEPGEIIDAHVRQGLVSTRRARV